MRKRTFGLFSAALLLATPALAQEMPKPAAEMSQLAYFEGSWSCEGSMQDTPVGPGGEMQSTVEIKKDLGGFFQTGLIKGTMKNMPPYEGHFHATYDPGAKQFVMLWVDNMGGWSQSTSSGWNGDTMVYEAESHMGPQTLQTRDTFTRSGPATMKHTWAAQMDGKWMTVGEETCRKK